MDTKDILYFRSCYDYRSMNLAAKELFITPQGLSKAIGRLESELDTQLFVRTSQGMIPTEAGEYFYKRSMELVHKISEITEVMKRMDKKNQVLHVGFASGALHVVRFEVVKQFRKKFADIHIKWDENVNNEVVQKLLQGKLDVAFTIGAFPVDGYMSRKVYETGARAIVYEGHPLYDRKSLNTSDLEGVTLISLNEQFYNYNILVRRCQECGFIPQIEYTTLESQMIYRYVREKYGVGIDVGIHDDMLVLQGIKSIPILDFPTWNIFMTFREDIMNQPYMKYILQNNIFK